MTELNNNKTEQQVSIDASRRTLLRNTATIAGIAAVAPAVSLAGTSMKNKKDLVKSPEEVLAEHERFIREVLNKYASKSKRIKPEYIDGFAKGFVELNGAMDYQESFKGLSGEYRLVKLFIRSVNSSRLPS